MDWKRKLQIQLAAEDIFDPRSPGSLHYRIESDLFSHHANFVHWDLLGSTMDLGLRDWRTYVVLPQRQRRHTPDWLED